MTTYPNWFAQYADDYFARHLTPIAGKPDLRFLQIGAFTGDASVWLLENVLTAPDAHLIDVDTWKGSDEPRHAEFDWGDVMTTYAKKVGNRRAAPFIGESATFFTGRWAPFDFVYIDGDHHAAAVLSDAVHAFDLLKPAGLLAFDDYQWTPGPDASPQDSPALAIDAFLSCYRDRLEVIDTGLMVWVRKTA